METDGNVSVYIPENQVFDEVGNGNPLSNTINIASNRFAPESPQNLITISSNQSLNMTWDQNTEGDFDKYFIYETITPRSLSFDGVNDYVSISYNTDLNNLNELSISAWVYSTESGLHTILENEM